MPKLRTLIVMGTRPEAIKLAPLVHACRRRSAQVEPMVCLTGQHRELLRPMVEYFELSRDIDLDLMLPDQSLAEFSARCLAELDAVLQEQQPDCVVVQGDTATASAAAMAAFYRQIPVVHVEAGLRTRDLQAPWPEEFNRRVITLAASLHCAPTRRAAENLLSEGVAEADVHITGNTVVDALHWTLDRERTRDADRLRRYDWLGDRPLVLVTAHRRESFGQGLEDVYGAIAELAARFPDTAFVVPVHLNPHVQSTAQRILTGRSNVHLLAPLPYPEFVWLLARCRLVLSDSGGVQEEAPSLGKPVVLMRETTERPEAVEAGAVIVAGRSTQRIVQIAERLLTDTAFYRAHQTVENPYGDGKSAVRIVELMLGRAWRRGDLDVSRMGRRRSA
jgi:UDP-N-acetylglucosamine 2-epimerase (non-hydrolysing)